MIKKVSIIVPIYNISDYIENCVGTLLKQSYPNIEILLVNDGSTDDSLDICKNLESLNKSVRLIDKSNGGLSSARNAGIVQAQGEYIAFIDGDDWIETNYIEMLVNAIEEQNCDIAVVHMKKETNYLSYDVKPTVDETRWRFFSRDQAMRELFTTNNIGYSACNKLYKKDLFKKIRYPVGKLMEDKGTTYKIIDGASNGIVVSSAKIYHYYMRPTSIMKSKFNIRRFDSFDIHEDILKYIKSKYPQLTELVEGRYVYEALRMIMSMIEGNFHEKSGYKRCIDIIQQYSIVVFRQSETTMLYKIILKSVLTFPNAIIFLSRLSVVRYLFKKMELM